MKAIKNIYIVMSCLIWLFACQSNSKSEEVLSETVMQNIVQDILLVDGYVATIARPDSAVMLRKAYLNAIYAKYKIDSNVYKKSATYYNAQPKLIEKMYEKIQVELDTLNKKNQKETDKILNNPPVLEKLEEIK